MLKDGRGYIYTEEEREHHQVAQGGFTLWEMCLGPLKTKMLKPSET